MDMKLFAILLLKLTFIIEGASPRQQAPGKSYIYSLSNVFIKVFIFGMINELCRT